MREHILKWFVDNAGSRALIVGDLNSSVHSLTACFGRRSNIDYLFEPDHKHGDLAVAKGLPKAESIPCDVDSTSKAHSMVVVMVPMPVGVVLAPNIWRQDWAGLAKPGPSQSESNAAKLAPSTGSGRAGKWDRSAASQESHPSADDIVAVVSGPSQSQSNAAKLAPPPSEQCC